MPNDHAAAAASGQRSEEEHATPGFQRFTDNLVEKAMLWALPRSARPNHLTVARFILIPVVLILLYYDHRWWALGVFAVAVCTDFVDGALARTRGQITRLGTFIDPLADKLLVGAVLAWIGYQYLVVQIILALIALELIFMAVGASITLRQNEIRGANAFGKTKMVVQSIALFMFLLFGFLDFDEGVTVSLYLLWAALALGVLSGATQIYDMLRRRASGL